MKNSKCDLLQRRRAGILSIPAVKFAFIFIFMTSASETENKCIVTVTIPTKPSWIPESQISSAL